ncbi:unnamed protein product [Blepharisma stoltei]|uniref:Uncharacterized protein n=1 Tax=Blepharisma stoltei TaxID=1481888 RepID=A0AAU9JZM4_9CILI|nr:unnamed protein product [Blepharisma stoltei]
MENNIQCFIKDCTKFPDFLCNCGSTRTFICNDHMRIHCLGGSSHQLSLIPINLKSEELRKSLNMKIKDIRYRRNEVIAKLSSYNQFLFEKLKVVLNKFERVEKNYSHFYNNEIHESGPIASPIDIMNQIEILMVDQLDDLKGNILDLTINFEPKQFFEAQLENHQNQMQNHLKKILEQCDEVLKRHFIDDSNPNNQDLFLMIENKISLLSNQLTIIQNFNDELKFQNKKLDVENKSLKMKLKSQENISECETIGAPQKKAKISKRRTPNNSILESNCIVSFTNNSKTINILNLITLDKEKINLNLPENLSDSISCCQIPDDRIFCYGNVIENKQYSGLAFIIDKNFEIKIIESYTPCTHSSCAYFDGHVFIFGGKNECQDLNIAAKYSISSNSWQKLPDMLVPSHGCSVVLFNNDFYISGINHDRIYSFNLESERYSDVAVKFKIGVPRIIICLKYSTMAFDSEENFYSSYSGKDWMFCKVSGFPNLIPSSYKVRKGKVLYFCCKSSFYRFQMNSKDRIKQIGF